MKTNFKNIIAVSALAFAGVFNANASENNAELFSSSENLVQTVDYRKEAQLVTRWFADMTEAKVTRMVMERSLAAPVENTTFSENEVENTIEMNDFRAEAQLITREIADREEARATRKVMEKGFVSPAEATSSVENEIDNFRMEAQLITKEIADREEAKVTQKVMDKGWVESSEESNYEETDFRAEALQMTHMVADREEVKALQKLVAEGRIAETK